MEKALCERMTDHGPCLGYAKGGQRLCRSHLGASLTLRRVNDRMVAAKSLLEAVKRIHASPR
jgi:hypothetical protein